MGTAPGPQGASLRDASRSGHAPASGECDSAPSDVFSETAWYGDYWEELIGLGGETRTRAYREAEYAATK